MSGDLENLKKLLKIVNFSHCNGYEIVTNCNATDRERVTRATNPRACVPARVNCSRARPLERVFHMFSLKNLVVAAGLVGLYIQRGTCAPPCGGNARPYIYVSDFRNLCQNSSFLNCANPLYVST